MKNNDTISKTLLVAVSLCLFCSAVISFTAVNLKDIQEANVRLDQQKKILASANLLDDEKSIEELFLNIESKIIDLRTGKYDSSIDLSSFKESDFARDENTSIILSSEQDIATIKRRENYQKVYLHYTMGCATGGCSDWDYTSQIFVRHRTGAIDSTLNTAPTFTVNGNTLDTVFFSHNPVYIYSWDSISNVLDSITSDTLEIIQFNDPNNPTTATGTLIGFASNMNIFSFDSLGVIIDSTYFSADTSWVVNYYNWYTPYDVIENYELARVITPYGSMLANNWEFTTTFDITDFAQILRDSAEIRCHYS